MPSKYANNPDYILNPSTGRYVKKTSKIGKKIVAPTSITYTPSTSSNMKIVKERGGIAVYLPYNKKYDKDMNERIFSNLNLSWMEEIKKIFKWKQGTELYLLVRDKGEWKIEKTSPGSGSFKINKYGLIEKNIHIPEIYRMTFIFVVIDNKYNNKVFETNSSIPKKLPIRQINEYKLEE